MNSSLIRRLGRQAALSGYAAYKWLETHTDDVERYAQKATDQARGKNYEKLVVPPATLARKVARWIDESGDSNISKRPKS